MSPRPRSTPAGPPSPETPAAPPNPPSENADAGREEPWWERPLVARRGWRWLSVRTAYRGGAILITLVVAAFAVGNWTKGAFDQVFPNEKVYTQLRELSAGIAVSNFEAALGPASIERMQSVTQYSGSGFVREQYVLRIYLEDQFVVTTLATEAGSTVLYTVLACNPQFEPAFVTPARSTLRLQREPLEIADVGALPPEDLSNVYLFAAGTVSSPDLYVEIPITVPSNQTGGRTYGFGVNGACGDVSMTTSNDTPVYQFNTSALGASSSDQPSGEDAAAAVRRYRAATAPDFYFETASDFTPPSSFAGNPDVDSAGVFIEMLSIVSPVSAEFPPRYAVDELD
ncbi:hypothetical protein [Herbiconiux solani]|uniref:hypothetical protein n=1 Tax=Herbiconiux solani TaxID=661329 RepID=UPI000826A2FD|nr:hypothetical protein [Herbiconiux solani]